MAISEEFTLGIEEEYLLVDLDTLALAEAPTSMMQDCQSEFGDQVSPEFLQCQVEVGTTVCRTIQHAREDLKRLRTCVSKVAKTYNLAPIAVSCHPFADWKDQIHTDRERYHDLQRALAGVARRMLISGMHVHIGIQREDLRIDLMNQLTYFLPHLLALSTSSPFWQGTDTGLASYRLTVFDNLPRTGLPPQFASWSEYERTVKALVDVGVIEDSSKIWWDMRPSSRYPTIESRICDVCPRLEDALTIAALTQCLARMLWRLSSRNQRWRLYDRFLVGENRWRAQRFGTTDGLIDFGQGSITTFSDLVDEMIELVAEDAAALKCENEVQRAREMVKSDTSAERQRKTYKAALASGSDPQEALNTVVRDLIEEFCEDL